MTGQYVHRQAAWRLIVAGQDISAAVRPRLISLSLTERRGTEADELSLELDDSDGQLAIPAAGADIELALGWRELGGATAPALIEKGRFKVDERGHSGAPDRVSIRARSADLTRAFRTRRTQSWRDVTLGDVLAEIAGRNGLQPAVAAGLGASAVDYLDQGRESDSAFLARLGRRYDAVATVKAGRLLFMPVGDGQTPGGQAIPGVVITRADGDRHSWKAAERDTYTGVIAHWHDRDGAERQEVLVGSAENARRLGRTYASAAAARRAAEAARARMARGKAEFSLTLAAGRADLYPERRVTVAGFKPEIDGAAWLIVEVSHSLSDRGFTTSLRMETGA